MAGHDKSSEWSSNIGFIIACVGSAVGLGNLWKFPYITYENGGGAFVAVYLLAIVVVGLPILLAEMSLGKLGHANIFQSFKTLSKDSPLWKAFALFLIITCGILLSFYSVVAGWTLEYFISSLNGSLAGLTAETVGPHFGAFVGNGTKQVTFHTAFIILTSFIIVKGTARIESAVKILMPVLAFLVFVIMGISISNYGGAQTFNFLFNMDFSKLTGHGVLEALGHAFFTLSLGMGVMIIYGSYLSEKSSIVKAGIWITILDTLIALMACLMIYPIIFGTNMKVAESASILFTTLTIQFHALPGGQFISALFYLLVAFAALSSTISLMEPVVSYVQEELRMPRIKATVVSGIAIWVVGIGSALSNGASSFFSGLAVMDNFDYFVSNWALTIGGAMISIFAGWMIDRVRVAKELEMSPTSGIFLGWLWLVRIFCPAAVGVIILYKLGIIG